MIDPSIKIAHYLPGRLRVRLSIPPRNTEKVEMEILSHKGVCSAKFNPITRSFLIYYNPTEIDTIEIIVRLGISLSVDYGMKSVNVFQTRQGIEFNNLDNYSLIATVAAWLAQLLNVKKDVLNILNYNAGFSTLVAVIKHALNEVKLSGSPHPEVVSSVYLVNAILKRNILLASTLTWLATFGRHVLAMDSDNITVQAFKVLKQDTHETYYDVAIKEFNHISHNNNGVKLFTDLIKHFIGMGNYETSSMLNKIRKLSKKHGDILEGLNNKNEMIFLRLVN